MKLLSNQMIIRPLDGRSEFVTKSGIVLLGKHEYAWDRRLRGVSQRARIEVLCSTWNMADLTKSAGMYAGEAYDEHGRGVSIPDLKVGDEVVHIYTIEDMVHATSRVFDGTFFGLEPGEVWLVTYWGAGSFYYVIRDGEMRVLGDNVIVKPIVQGEQGNKRHIIWTPDLEKPVSLQGIVVLVGPGCTLKPGQRIVYSRYSDIPVPMTHPDYKNDQLGYWVMNEFSDVFAVCN